MRIKQFLNTATHYGDMLAIPFFAGLVYYFYEIEDKTLTEYVLFAFSIGGFFIDLLFTFLFLYT